MENNIGKNWYSMELEYDESGDFRFLEEFDTLEEAENYIKDLRMIVFEFRVIDDDDDDNEELMTGNNKIYKLVEC